MPPAFPMIRRSSWDDSAPASGGDGFAYGALAQDDSHNDGGAGTAIPFVSERPQAPHGHDVIDHNVAGHADDQQPVPFLAAPPSDGDSTGDDVDEALRWLPVSWRAHAAWVPVALSMVFNSFVQVLAKTIVTHNGPFLCVRSAARHSSSAGAVCMCARLTVPAPLAG